VARDLVVWWHCVSDTAWRPPARPWRGAEIEALGAAGVRIPDPAERLAAEARAWRQVVLAARKRLVLVMPRWAAGDVLEPHPIWDEIVARMGATSADVRRVTCEARDLLSGRSAPRAAETADLGLLPLPEARTEWRIDGKQLRPALRHSASGLEALVGCPLRWVLAYGAGVREGGIASISPGPILLGSLGHRLVEELHGAGVLARGEPLERHVDEHLDRLLQQEGAVLLRPGMTFELAQLRKQYLVAVKALADLLAESGLTILDVESAIEVKWRRGLLTGRLDLLLQDAKGAEVVIDLKWGQSSYREKLKAGTAIQLAVYVTARRLATGAKKTPPAGYFGLRGGKLMTVDGKAFPGAQPVAGPSLDETWTKLEHTVERVEQDLALGRVLVTGVKRSPRLLEALAAPEAERQKAMELEPGAACEYCTFGAICGKSWEGLT
jgi:RecB family exonuclease